MDAVSCKSEDDAEKPLCAQRSPSKVLLRPDRISMGPVSTGWRGENEEKREKRSFFCV